MTKLITMFLLLGTCLAYSDRIDEDDDRPGYPRALEDIPGSRSSDGGVGKND